MGSAQDLNVDPVVIQARKGDAANYLLQLRTRVQAGEENF